VTSAVGFDQEQNRYRLIRHRTVYTPFELSLDRITTSEAGPVENFLEDLQERLDKKLEDGNPPEAPTLADLLDD
jgi:hypothetical protein